MGAKKGLTDQEIIEALNVHKTDRAAAEALGCNASNICRRRQQLERRGLWNKYTGGIVPPGYYVKGKSILYDSQGNERLTWVKSNKEADDLHEALRACAESLIDNIQPATPVAVPPQSNSDLMNLYVLTDYHLGMKCWGEETGDDWDLDIAEKLLYRWIDHAVKHSPDAEEAVLAQMGDFMHWDGIEAVTPSSKHILDADTRLQKVIRVAIRTMTYFCYSLLQKHQRVTLIQTGGNHDPAGTLWMREMLKVYYGDESRLTVDNSPDLYFCYAFGKVSNFFHHGHKRNVKQCAETFVTRFRNEYGSTEYSYGHIGHLHCDEVAEVNGIRIERHRTLAPKDSYADQGGWSSGRDSKVITYHRNYGEVSRLTISPEILK